MQSVLSDRLLKKIKHGALDSTAEFVCTNVQAAPLDAGGSCVCAAPHAHLNELHPRSSFRSTSPIDLQRKILGAYSFLPRLETQFHLNGSIGQNPPRYTPKPACSRKSLTLNTEWVQFSQMSFPEKLYLSWHTVDCFCVPQ